MAQAPLAEARVESGGAGAQEGRGLSVSNSKQFLDEGIQAAEAGNKDLARDLFWKALQENPDNEQAWLWRMSFARSKQELIDHGRQVLRIDPANAQVLGWLEKFCRKEGIAMPTPAPSVPPELVPPSAPSAEVAKPLQIAPKAQGPIAPVHTGEPLLPLSGGGGLKTGLQPRPVPVARSEPKPSPSPVPPAPAAAPPAAARSASSPGAGHSWICPLCNQASEHRGTCCKECGAIVELDDLQPIGRSADVNRDLLGRNLKILMRLLDQQPSAEHHKVIATIHLNLNNSSEALSHLAEAVRLAPDDAKVRAHLHFLKTQRIVLVVDPDEEVVRTAADILEPYRLRVVPAVNGLQALSQLEKEMPDLILLNMELPRMDGFEVCKILRKNAAAKDLPIIMLQNEGGMVGKLRGRLAGVAGSVTKPLSAEVLRQLLKKHLPDSYLPDPALSSGTFKL